MERLFLFIQGNFFSKKGVRNLYIIALVLFAIALFFCRKNLLYVFNMDDKDKFTQLNNNLFNLSGILAGFIFTSLGVISSANNELVNQLKDTDNFSLLGNYYVYAILNFILVIVISLIESFIVNKNIIVLFFTFKVFSFIFANLLFLISLYFTKKMLFKK